MSGCRGPRGWQAPRTAERHPVVVALDEDTPRDAVLTAAFQEAEFLRTGVVVLHASPYRKGASSGIEAEEASLVEQLAGWKQDHPDVSVQAMVVSGDGRQPRQVVPLRCCAGAWSTEAAWMESLDSRRSPRRGQTDAQPIDGRAGDVRADQGSADFGVDVNISTTM